MVTNTTNSLYNIQFPCQLVCSLFFSTLLLSSKKTQRWNFAVKNRTTNPTERMNHSLGTQPMGGDVAIHYLPYCIRGDTFHEGFMRWVLAMSLGSLTSCQAAETGPQTIGEAATPVFATQGGPLHHWQHLLIWVLRISGKKDVYCLRCACKHDAVCWTSRYNTWPHKSYSVWKHLYWMLAIHKL